MNESEGQTLLTHSTHMVLRADHYPMLNLRRKEDKKGK